MSSLFYYLPLFLVLYLLTEHYLVHKIRNLPPKPFSLPILGHLLFLKKPLHRTLAKLADTHGPLIYLQLGSRRAVVASSPSIVEEFLSKNDLVFANRPNFLLGRCLGYNNTLLSLSPYGDHWRNLRRIFSAELLSASRLAATSRVRVDEVKSMVSRLYRNESQTVNMKTLFSEVLLNSLTMMIAGRRYYGENITHEEEAKKFREAQEENFRLTGVTNIGDYLPWIRPKRWLVESLTECARKRAEFAQFVLDDKYESNTEGNFTMVQFLLSMAQKQPNYYTDDIIKGIVLTILSAGSDTSINTMEWAMSLLVNNPEALDKAQQEMDNLVGNDRLVEESDLSNLPYLRGIIRETMRMYPVLPLLVPHLSSEECVVEGYTIPSDTMLFVNLWAIHNDPKLWADPRKFKPERFEGQVDGVRDGFRLLPFGSGRRSCPGEALALRTMGLVLGSLVQCFDWATLRGEIVDMTEGAGITMPKRQPLTLVCQPRPKMGKLLSQL